MNWLRERGIWKRGIHLVALTSLVLIAFDAYHLPSTSPTVLEPLVWFTLYSIAAASVLLFVATGRLIALQVMTLSVMTIGVLHGVLFFLEDDRLTPLGLNMLIAVYAVLAHRYERVRIWR